LSVDDNLRKPPIKYKDPEAVKDYQLDWTDYLTELAAGDTIAESAWSVTVAPDETLIIGADTLAHPATTVWLSGGTVDKTYWVTNHVTTAGGREDDQSIIIKIKQM
jgi:hypothetical protein